MAKNKTSTSQEKCIQVSKLNRDCKYDASNKKIDSPDLFIRLHLIARFG